MAGTSWVKLRHIVPLWRASRLNPASSNFMFQQTRHKGQRFKLPPEPKEREKRIKKLAQAADQAVRNPKELEEFLKRVPVDDVWLREHYPVQRFSFADAILMHTELASPEMFDNLDGLVVAETEFDMSTKKKTKFLGAIKGTVLFPHHFDDGLQNRVVAITKNLEDQDVARRYGAEFVGGLDIIKLIERGEIRHDDYTHLVCNVDILTEVTIIKKHLKDHFPSRKKGNLGADIGGLVNLYVQGRSFTSTKITDAVSKISIAFGRLNMTENQLRENLQSFIDSASLGKVSANSKLVKKLTIQCPPSAEAFVLRAGEFVPRVSAAGHQEAIEDNDAEISEDKLEEDEVKAEAL